MNGLTTSGNALVLLKHLTGKQPFPFVNGVSLTPVPPVTPVAMGRSSRGVEIESMGDLDELQIAAWMKQITALPGVGGKKRKA